MWKVLIALAVISALWLISSNISSTMGDSSSVIVSSIAQACAFAPALFQFQGSSPSPPVLAHGPSSRWDGKYINPGGMLYHDGQFHMFRNGFHNWPGVISIGHGTSDDGLNWTDSQIEPVWVSDRVSYADPGLDVDAVLVLDDGTWVMYFHTVNSRTAWEIGRATAPAPTGPWRADAAPVLSPGPEGSWDDRHVKWPSVLQTDSGFLMFYAGQNLFGETSIGLATSSDGISWTKHNDTSTTGELFIESDPVLTYAKEWEGTKVDRPEVQLTPDGFVMIYQGGPELNDRGIAISSDGINWSSHSDNPVITGSDFPQSNTTSWDTALVYNDGAYYYFMEIGTLAFTDIYLAVHDGHFCS